MQLLHFLCSYQEYLKEWANHLKMSKCRKMTEMILQSRLSLLLSHMQKYILYMKSNKIHVIVIYSTRNTQVLLVDCKLYGVIFLEDLAIE